MGICMSCLGRERSSTPTSDTSQLLGEGYQHAYGAVASSNLQQTDPEEIGRQRDALERLCAQTSDQLIDVAQSHPLDDVPRPPSDLARLFADRDNSPQPTTNAESEEDYEQRSDEDEETWLRRVAPPLVNGVADWDVVHTIEGEICLSADGFVTERERLEALAEDQENQEDQE
ncbi:hypothetical protein P152DRAFT_461133 [Eremomyces bilateralis CBS 781.70]|uniref:Late endosomal/lysosomal adaptor and MAPK and MTOR activator-domain-containing protein n=1 Tax=Eremomyces bilateralis CBS 781.70 TaxID=1392243 RepID=A0A6G1FV21_9PEZI|nr:uncharacterized protein P152DRAFT_461133 [Eremomyces bilateralis CBS 781.70]KAF1809745.1 hypothetical protein P152DRAFT_461133 [Eremomyces bilateralis CBS 781.70]